MFNLQERDRVLAVRTPDWDRFFNSSLALIWIGHASVLVNVHGISVLCDPVFSERASPSQWFGPKRLRRTPFTVEQMAHEYRSRGLAGPDVVCISHNHYDHLDLSSIETLVRAFPNARYLVPSGLHQWMHDTGARFIEQFTWWQEKLLHRGGSSTPSESASLLTATATRSSPQQLPQFRAICVPAQHWSMRSGFDRMESLWCGWIFESLFGDAARNRRFYFAGDTGYALQLFPAIGAHFGPLSLAAIPIGAYEPRWFMGPQHVDPKQAVQVHCDVRAERSVGIHWGTFELASEPYNEPPAQLAEAVREAGLGPNSFTTVNIGEVLVVQE